LVPSMTSRRDLLASVSSRLKVFEVDVKNTVKRVRLIASVMAPREKTPHKATFCLWRSLMQLRTKKGKMNTAISAHGTKLRMVCTYGTDLMTSSKSS
jgi:hypothetical protein